MASIFLSHSHADKRFVRRLGNDLRQAGVKVWVDEAEIMIGDSLIEKIGQGIAEMEYVGVVLSRSSVTSEWVRREVDIALNQEIRGKRVKVLPRRIEKCELPEFLQGKLYADFRNRRNYREQLANVLRRIIGAYPDHRPRGGLEKRQLFEPEMVLIPAGEFLMGSDPNRDQFAEDDEKPLHQLYLPDYY